jgi:hypothetical protein
MSEPNCHSEWFHLHDARSRNQFFGEVQHRLAPDGRREVKLIVKPDPELGFELARAALAIDGSKSMMQSFAGHLPKMLRRSKNTIQPVAQSLAQHLAANARGQVAVAYWACGDEGGDVEPVGLMSKEDLNTFTFEGPKRWGGGTKLTPVTQYFWEQIFADATGPGLALVLTDGAWDDADHAQLQQLTQVMCDEIATGRRQLMKVVLVGLRLPSNAGELDYIQSRFSSLDDFQSGVAVDIWDHKWLDEIEDLSEIFVELVQDWPLGVGGFVEADGVKVLETDEFRFGIQFTLPANASSFTLHLKDAGDYQQQIV